jgi:integrase
MSITLTDRKLRALKPAPKGERYEVHDSVIRGLRVRVSDQGSRIFVFRTRYPGSTNPTRRTLGEYPSMTLEAAREKADEWRKLIKRGIDPGVREADERRAEAQRAANKFGVMAEDFLRKKVMGTRLYDEFESQRQKVPAEKKALTEQPLERRWLEVARVVRGELMPLWHDRPATEVTRREIQDVIEAKAETAPAQARNVLAIIKRMFTWALHTDRYGLNASPADALKPTIIIGERVSGDRVLDDKELFALLRAVSRTAYPYGPAYELLILTALRLNEAADARWSEFDLANARWIIPAARMKGKNAKARSHAVPLTADVLAVLKKLPRFRSGDCLFSTTSGKSPVWMSDKVKKRIDERMLSTLRALARRRGEDPAKVKLAHWTNHDIRRTVRTNMSALRVPEEVREAVLAHVRPGIKGTYDLYDYFDEKRDALEKWAARLREIMTPAPANVVKLRA